MVWSTERMDVLRTMWLEGRSSGEIAKVLGDVSRNAVMGKVDRMGLMRSEDHNSRMTAVVTGACRPAPVVVQAPEPEPEVVPEPIDPKVVRLSHGVVHRACAGASRGVIPDWRLAMSLVSELTGQPFSWDLPGHRASLVGMATMLVGDPRRILCPKLGEPVVLGFMRRFAAEGMVVGGKTPPRWCEMENGDEAFFEDMLIAEDVKERPEIIVTDPVPATVESPSATDASVPTRVGRVLEPA